MENIVMQPRGSCLVAVCTGDITIDISAQLKKEMQNALEGGSCRSLVMDLSGVSFMDSSGIGSLVAVKSKAQNQGKGFFLFRPSSQVRKTLELVQLLSFFEVIEDEDELELAVIS